MPGEAFFIRAATTKNRVGVVESKRTIQTANNSKRVLKRATGQRTAQSTKMTKGIAASSPHGSGGEKKLKGGGRIKGQHEDPPKARSFHQVVKRKNNYPRAGREE